MKTKTKLGLLFIVAGLGLATFNALYIDLNHYRTASIILFALSGIMIATGFSFCFRKEDKESKEEIPNY